MEGMDGRRDQPFSHALHWELCERDGELCERDGKTGIAVLTTFQPRSPIFTAPLPAFAG
jgi:hypothetical protein